MIFCAGKKSVSEKPLVFLGKFVNDKPVGHGQVMYVEEDGTPNTTRCVSVFRTAHEPSHNPDGGWVSASASSAVLRAFGSRAKWMKGADIEVAKGMDFEINDACRAWPEPATASLLGTGIVGQAVEGIATAANAVMSLARWGNNVRRPAT